MSTEGYNYFLEMWFRNSTGTGLREMYGITEEGKTWWPHITLVRPFRPRLDGIKGEREVKQLITSVCQDEFPIPFCLNGLDSFGEDIKFIPVIREKSLLRFSNNLEELLKPSVDFVERPSPEKTLHVTVPQNVTLQPFPESTFYMLRLTAIRQKKIWFSYDFVTQETLNRRDSKNKTRWHRSVELFRSTKC